ncbi:MAG: guanylate kinase [candidate division Zixibacteria bacterium]|nr:guanylate kinase [candidate division Zixibacteria bacterium]
MSLQKAGKIVIISSPSGGGKTSICRRLLELNDNQNWHFSVSYTTRAMRSGEKNHREYHFVDDDTFERLSNQGKFAEVCRVHLYQYGTPREPIEEVLHQGGVILLDIDVQGTVKIKDAYPEAVSIFILPPSVDELCKRLMARGTETEEQLKIRRDNAAKEMYLWKNFDYVVINDEFDVAINEVQGIITGHYCRTDVVNEKQILKIIG